MIIVSGLKEKPYMKKDIGNDSLINPLSVDCVIFGFEEEQLKVLLIKRDISPALGSWALPGGFIKYNESIDHASERVLYERTGVEGLYMQQLGAFGEVDRFPDHRVITIVYYALVKQGQYNLNNGTDEAKAAWYDINDIPKLAFDHSKIIDEALNRLRLEAKHKPIGFNLLPDKFPLLALQALYEAIYNTTFDKPNFRRKIMKMNIITPLNEKQTGVAHRSARLYRFDKKRYEELRHKGYIFDI